MGADKPKKLSEQRNHCSRWTIKELQFVEKQYGNLPTQEIAEKLGRSVNGVRRVVGLLGLTKKRVGPWDEEEIAILHAHYQRGVGIADVQSLLPHRSRGAIHAQASQLGITGRESWSDSEKGFLEKHYGTMPTQKIAATLGRSVSAVRRVVNMLQLGQKQTGSWTEQEMDVLRTHYAKGTGLAHVQTLLPQRSRSSITVQASKMNLTRVSSWHPDEDRILRECYPVMGAKVVDKLPHRTVPAIKHQAKKLGLKYHRQKPRETPVERWTDEE